MARGAVSITLNCLSGELGASLTNISIFPLPKIFLKIIWAH